MLLRRYCKWVLLAGLVFILLIKFWIRPFLPLDGWLLNLCGLAPNFIASFSVPFLVYWLLTGTHLTVGRYDRLALFTDLRLVSLAGFLVIVINEYFQKLPVFGRTFDYLDLIASAIGQVLAFVAFSRLQKRITVS